MTDNILDDQSNEIASFYEVLVGEDKKFKDNEALAKAKVESDKFIEQLKAENNEMRTKLSSFNEQSDAKANLEVLIDRLSKLQNSTNNNPSKVENEPKFDPNTLEPLVSKKVQETISAFESQKQMAANRNMVRDKLKEQYGDEYSRVVREQIKDLGITEDRFNALAAEAPQLLLKTLVPGRRETFQAPPRGNNTFTPKGQPKRTWSYYQELKKSNPGLYKNPTTMAQMERDMVQLGDAFHDGDFNRFEPKSFDTLVM